MCEGPNGFVQAGIVSWGINCGLNDVPGVYVNPGNYVCWIKNIVEEVTHFIKNTLIIEFFRLKGRIIFLTLRSVILWEKIIIPQMQDEETYLVIF